MSRRAWVAVVVVAYLAWSLALEWPGPAHFSTMAFGNRGDAWQHIWNFWWVKHALLRLQNPFFTPLLYHPTGCPLWLHTLDLPDALPAIAVSAVLNPIATFNFFHLAAYVLTAVAAYQLARELGAARPGAFVAGALATALPYHSAQAIAHLSLLPLQWPLWFALCFRRALTRPERRWWLATGLLAAVSIYANWYFGPLDGMLALAVLAEALLARRAIRGAALRVAGAVALAAALVVPFAVKGALDRAKEPYDGDHPPGVFVADVEELLWPGTWSAWARVSGSRPYRWTGNVEENGAYVGYALFTLGVIGFTRRKKLGAPWLALAAFGIVTSLGPELHVGGRLASARGALPMAWLDKALPFLVQMACPVRWEVLAGLSFALLSAFAVDALWAWRRPLALVALLPLVELWPAPATLSSFPEPPALFAEWAKDPRPWAVLDVNHFMQTAWDELHHGHPSLTAGYISRRPHRLDVFLEHDPVVSTLWMNRVAPLRVLRDDEAIDFDWGRGPPIDTADPDNFTVRWTGTLVAPVDGDYQLTLTSDDGATVTLDGKPAVDDPPRHSRREKTATVHLAKGPHALDVEYWEYTVDAVVRLEWAGPGFARQVIPASALRTPDGKPGLRGEYNVRAVAFPVPPEQALDELRRLGVRFLVYPGWRRDYAVEHQLGARAIFANADYRIYELPSP